MKKIRATNRCALLVCTLSILLSGCWDRREINDVAFVLANAFDVGQNKMNRETILVALPGQMGGATGGGGGTSGKAPYYTDSADGTSISEDALRLQFRMARVLNFSHRRVIVIGHELAEQGIRYILDIMARYPQNRITTYFVMAEAGKGEELLKAKPHLERFPGEAIREILSLNPAGKVSLKEVWEKLSKPGVDFVLPVFKTVKSMGKESTSEISLSGIALFSGQKVKGIMTGDEAQALLSMINKFQAHREVLDLKKNQRVVVFTEMGKNKLELLNNKPPFRYRITIRGEGSIVENTSSLDFANEQDVRKAEQLWGKTVKMNVEHVVENMKKWHSDVIGAGNLVYQLYPQTWSSVQDKWYKHLAESQFEVKVDMHIIRVGQITKNVEMGKVTGK